MKALAKEPGRRYGSVAALAADIKRHLDQKPISARPASAVYRMNRFVRRNRAGVLGAVLLVVALAAGVVSTVNQARVAAQERDRAERSLGDVRRLANTMLFDLHDTLREVPGATPAMSGENQIEFEWLTRVMRSIAPRCTTLS